MSEPYESDDYAGDPDDEHRVADDRERAQDWRDQFRTVE